MPLWHGALGLPQLATLVGISLSSVKALRARTKNHRSRRPGKATTTTRHFRTTKNHDQTTLEGKTVDFSTFWWIEEPKLSEEICPNALIREGLGELTLRLGQTGMVRGFFGTTNVGDSRWGSRWHVGLLFHRFGPQSFLRCCFPLEFGAFFGMSKKSIL